MLERMDLSSGQRASFSGEEVGAHDELAAERLLRKGMKVAGCTQSELTGLRKGAEEKALLAWLIRRNTAVSNAWIANRLQMGRADCLSRYIKQIEDCRDDRMEKIKLALMRVTKLRD
jgi:hypothetical protein